MSRILFRGRCVTGTRQIAGRRRRIARRRATALVSLPEEGCLLAKSLWRGRDEVGFICSLRSRARRLGGRFYFFAPGAMLPLGMQREGDMPNRITLLVVSVCLVSTVQAGAASYRDRQASAEEEYLPRLPACFSKENAEEVYWASARLGRWIAELQYLAPLWRQGRCSWVRQDIPTGVSDSCQLASYECAGLMLLFWQGELRPVYGVIWPDELE